jgi:predicted DNA-binding protein (MmcQ/YjbR family)
VKPDPFHDRLLAIVTSLPGAYEDRPWGSVHCKVAGKIFVGWSRLDDGRMRVGLRTDKELQALLVASDPRFSITAYVGKHGWGDMKLGPKPVWKEVEAMVRESYRMIAPKKLVKELAAPGDESATPIPRAAPKKKPAPKPARGRKADREHRPKGR